MAEWRGWLKQHSKIWLAASIAVVALSLLVYKVGAEKVGAVIFLVGVAGIIIYVKVARGSKPKTASRSKSSTRARKPTAEATRNATERTLRELSDAKVEKYEVSTCGDSRVCAACRAQEGKKYYVKDAVIGVNAPPFCEECRCIILGVF